MSRSILTRLALLLALIALPLYALKVYDKTDYTDFSVYHQAATRMAQGKWSEIYTLADGASPFRYPPLVLPLLRPLAWLELRPAQLGWYFLQVAALIAGFFAIYRAAGLATRRGRRSWLAPAAITAAAFLFVLRFCLDSFTIGQVSTIMFAGWAYAMLAFMTGRAGRAGIGLLAPTLFKISPGFSYFLLLLRPRPGRWLRAIAAPSAVVLALLALVSAWPKGIANLELWTQWMRIVQLDSSYYDSSHYGSQSLNSFLLRAVNSGWLTPTQALEGRIFATLVGCGTLLLFWWLRRWSSPRGRGLALACGVFPYLWFMPETFKYSLIVLALPVAMLLSTRRFTALTAAALAVGAAFLSLAGKDVVGDSIFFGVQHASLPFFATLLLGAATLRESWLESRPSRLLARVQTLLRPDSVGPWPSLPDSQASLAATLIVPLPLSSMRLLSPGIVARTLEECRQALERVHPRNWEILVVPYGDRVSWLAPELEEARSAVSELPRARVLEIDGQSRPGRGGALRDGFLASRGQVLWIANPEQPCDAAFFELATRKLQSGHDLVRANRRHPESRFRIPVRVLPYVYGRHRLGLAFNRLVRIVLPISAEDTHSGTAVLTRRLATHAFSLQRYPDFLFELELSLTALGHGMKEASLPVVVRLPEEKGVRRMSHETIAIALGLPSLFRRYHRGFYSPMMKSGIASGITADDWGISPEVNSGILDLARQGVVRRVSLMAGCPYLELGLAELRGVQGVELGLHFNLTYGDSAVAGKSPGRFLLDWCTGGRKRLAGMARAELKLQLDRLEQAGVRARYVDGHHHIHLVPGLLRELAPEIKSRGIRRVRLPYDPALWFTPKLPLAALSLAARGELRRQGFEHAACFYPQAAHFQDHGRLQQSLARDSRAEVIVHPARSNDFALLAIEDPYTDGRVVEYRALSMLAFRMRAE